MHFRILAKVIHVNYHLHVCYTVPVQYTVPLQDVDVKEGEKAVLTCEINKPGLTSTWSRDGEAITPDNNKYTITVENFTHTLTIDDCDIDDDAEYSITIDECSSVGNVFVEGKFTDMVVLPTQSQI